jgi:hypothetical protein
MSFLALEVLPQLPPAISCEASRDTVVRTTFAEAATEHMHAAAALIEARQRSLDAFNAQLYHTKKLQHKIDGVDWHETHQVPGYPRQPQQPQPIRVGTLHIITISTSVDVNRFVSKAPVIISSSHTC